MNLLALAVTEGGNVSLALADGGAVDAIPIPVPAGPGLLATYSADNGSTDVALPPATLATLATTGPIVPVDPTEKLIVSASVYVQCDPGGSAGTVFLAVEVSEDGGPFVPVDGVGETFASSSQGVISRTFELVGVIGPPHSYVVRTQAELVAPLTGGKVVGRPPGSGLFPGARLVVQRCAG